MAIQRRTWRMAMDTEVIVRALFLFQTGFGILVRSHDKREQAFDCILSEGIVEINNSPPFYVASVFFITKSERRKSLLGLPLCSNRDTDGQTNFLLKATRSTSSTDSQ